LFRYKRCDAQIAGAILRCVEHPTEVVHFLREVSGVVRVLMESCSASLGYPRAGAPVDAR
jgi:hypothetical protein